MDQRSEPKATLHRYLQDGRAALLWKLEGLSEYDVRRPLTPTGTNLLGLVKHLASVEVAYFGDAFGRPFAEPLPWVAADAAPNDMWATAAESRAYIIGLYQRARDHCGAGTGGEGSGAVVGRRPERGDAAPHPRPHDR